ncbi:MAG: hypothetical protein ABL966_09880 [Acidimicrobiales bacterium]
MFNSYEMTKTLVAERQATLHHEARQHRLGRAFRRGHRGQPVVRSIRAAVSLDRPSAGAAPLEDRLAA